MTQDMPDAKAEFVQERLLEAAAEVLASVSNAAMPLRIVAARAGATTGAIQYYFGDKRGLLLAVMRKHGLRVVARLQLLETDTLPAPLVRVRKILFEFLPLDEERRSASLPMPSRASPSRTRRWPMRGVSSMRCWRS